MELFQSSAGELLPVEDAELLFWPRVEFGDHPALLDQLIRDTPWRAETVTLWGKTHPQPRLVAWYGDDTQVYSYSGIVLHALPMTHILNNMKEKVEALCQCSFNSVLLNYYRDHTDSMGLHADDEPELGPCPDIASVSLGATRPFVFKHKTRKHVADVKLPLPSGSMVLMKGATQANWKHGLPKLSTPCGPRVNLTFRTIVS